jgi:aspartate aminotransferase
LEIPHLSGAVQRIKASATVAMTAEAARLKDEGVDVIALSVGEPDFPTPDHIAEAAIEALARGDTRYTAVSGTLALRQAVAAKFARDNGMAVDPANVVIGTGGKQCLFNALIASLEEGDEAVIPTPCWVSYPDIVTLAGARPVLVPTGPDTGYKLTPEMLEAHVTPNTRWLILNSPSNPTGALYSPEELAALGEVVRRHPALMVLSDDVYEYIRYDARPFATMASLCPDLAERTLTLNSMSKGFAMTGWRVGFATGPSWLIKAMVKLQSQSTTNACSISQAAAVAALNGPTDFLPDWIATFDRRRQMVVEGLNAIPGFACDMPEGAFYAWIRTDALVGARAPDGSVLEDDSALALYLLREARVALVQGSAFCAGPALRLSFAASDEVLREALARIAAAIGRLDF